MNNYYELILARLNELQLSPSHDINHVELVLEYAEQLHSIYGGDWEVISAASLLHDLGRIHSDLHDDQSISKSIEYAKAILDEVGFHQNRIEQVIQAIQDHDKPYYSPNSIEGRILKDSDFLAGFGSQGILRTAMWAGETRKGISGFNELTKIQMLQRIKGLEFVESKHLANKEYQFVRLFNHLFDNPPRLDQRYPGKYIILEGNSGTGKDTQADTLVNYFDRKGMTTIKINEPSDYYVNIKNFWKDQYGQYLSDTDPLFRRYLILADRIKQINDLVLPSLESVDLVISVRSYLSMLVYQCEDDFDRIFFTFLHQFVPIPDLVIIYDLPEEIAHERIMKRGGEESKYDRFEELRNHREDYLKLSYLDVFGCPIEILDASGSETEVAEITLKTISTIFE